MRINLINVNTGKSDNVIKIKPVKTKSIIEPKKEDIVITTPVVVE